MIPRARRLAIASTVAIAIVAVLTIGAQTAPQEPAHTPARTPGTPAAPDIILRASAYVTRFVESASVLVARETYVQEVKERTNRALPPPDTMVGVTTDRRTLESDVALVQVVADQLWLLARDVVSVDGRSLPDAQRMPLEALHPRTRDEALAHFKKVAAQGARFNIGVIRRDVNVPTLALWFLTPGVLERFAFTPAGTERVDGVMCDVVRYEERAKPFLFNANGVPGAAKGRFWINPQDGVVMRTEWILSDPDAERAQAFGVRAIVTTSYVYSDAVQAWVPGEMRERYDYANANGFAADAPSPGSIIATARYTGYRKFTVESRILK